MIQPDEQTFEIEFTRLLNLTSFNAHVIDEKLLLADELIQIETKVRSEASGYSSEVASPQMHSPWLAGVNVNHPSQERFGVEEATVSELVDFFQGEKTCTVEPGGKPCDHCAMCSSRGF